MRSLDKEKPPRKNPGGHKNPIGWASVLERIAALAVRDFGRRDFQAHLPAQHARNKSPYRVSLPAGGFHEICAGGATGALQQVQELGSFAALAAAGGLLARLDRLCGLVGFLCPGGLFGRLALRRRDVARVCAHTRLFCRSWLPNGALTSILVAFSGTSFILISPLAAITATITSITLVASDCKRIP